MTEWMMEHWFVEAVLCIAVGFVLAIVVCKLAELLDRE
jgi:hypothetical protein